MSYAYNGCKTTEAKMTNKKQKGALKGAILYTEANDFLRKTVQERFGHCYESAAKKMGTTGDSLRNELCRPKKDRNPGWLLEGLGLELVTFVRPARNKK